MKILPKDTHPNLALYWHPAFEYLWHNIALFYFDLWQTMHISTIQVFLWGTVPGSLGTDTLQWFHRS